MRLFIDCEWNEFGGDLISMALVPESMRYTYFYAVLPCLHPGEWVAEHVIPVMWEYSPRRVANSAHLASLLAGYLDKFETCHIVADWPEDIERFCKALITGPGMRIATPPLTMEILRVDSVSAIPHNAFADASAFCRAVVGEVKI